MKSNFKALFFALLMALPAALFGQSFFMQGTEYKYKINEMPAPVWDSYIWNIGISEGVVYLCIGTVCYDSPIAIGIEVISDGRNGRPRIEKYKISKAETLEVTYINGLAEIAVWTVKEKDLDITYWFYRTPENAIK